MLRDASLASLIHTRDTEHPIHRLPRNRGNACNTVTMAGTIEKNLERHVTFQGFFLTLSFISISNLFLHPHTQQVNKFPFYLHDYLQQTNYHHSTIPHYIHFL